MSSTAKQDGEPWTDPTPIARDNRNIQQALAALDLLTLDELLVTLRVVFSVHSEKPCLQAAFWPMIEPLVQSATFRIRKNLGDAEELLLGIGNMLVQLCELDAKIDRMVDKALIVAVNSDQIARESVQIGRESTRLARSFAQRLKPFNRRKNRNAMYKVLEQVKQDQPTWRWDKLFEVLKADYPEQMRDINKPATLAANYRRWRNRRRRK